MENLLYDLGDGVRAFSTRRDCVPSIHIVMGHQVHDDRVAIVDRPDLTREDLEGYDALVTCLPGCPIAVRTADCVPVLLYDPVERVVAAVHSGWKGTVRRISQKTISVMASTFGCKSANLRAVIGPCIAAESFQVGEEVVKIFKEQGFPLNDIWFFNKGAGESPMYHGHHIDIVKANRWILEEAGVLPENIQASGIDTYTDESFFSARREGISCGRILNVVELV